MAAMPARADCGSAADRGSGSSPIRSADIFPAEISSGTVLFYIIPKCLHNVTADSFPMLRIEDNVRYAK